MVLSTHKTSNYPTLIKYNGGKDPNFSGLNFQMASDTEAAGSCSAILNGEFYMFGGRTSGTKRQVKHHHLNSDISSILDFKNARMRIY